MIKKLRTLAKGTKSILMMCWALAQARVAMYGKRGALERTHTAAQRGQTGNLVSLVIGVMIAGIVVMQVFIPVINDANSNLSGTEQTIADLLPLFGVLLVLIALASPLMRRV